MVVRLAPASSIGQDDLAGLFTAVYAGYWHPVEVDAAGLRRMVTLHDLDLDASIVAVDAGTPVAVGVLGIRGRTGWVGGMGVLPERRREGLGRLVTEALLRNAERRGVRRVRLEVLEQNAPALAVYRALGFRELGDVVVWQLDEPPDGDDAVDADVDDVVAELAPSGADAPWQRNAATIARLRDAGAELVAVRAEGGAALFTTAETRAALQEMSAPSAAVASTLLRAAFERGAEALLWLNAPVEGSGADAMRAAGATQLALQHELEWRSGA